MSTNTSCNQWLSLAKPTFKVASIGRNCTLVARTIKCGWAIILSLALRYLGSGLSVGVGVWPFFNLYHLELRYLGIGIKVG